MERFWKKLLGGVLALILGITPAVMASAMEGVTNYNTGEEVSVMESLEMDSPEKQSEMLSQDGYRIEINAAAKKITVPLQIAHRGLVYMTLIDDIYMQEIDTSDENIPLPEGLTDDVKITLYEDSACTKAVDSTTASPLLGLGIYMSYLKAPETGTYYVEISIDSYKKESNIILDCLVQNVPCIDRVLKNNKAIFSGFIDSNPLYFEINAPSDGIFNLDISLDGEINEKSDSGKDTGPDIFSMPVRLALCDKNKKEISAAGNWKDFLNVERAQKTFGVKKGRYFLKISAYSKQMGTGMLYLKNKFSALNNKSGSLKSSAKSLKQGAKEIKSLERAGELKANWYKFKISKAKKITATVSKKLAQGDLKVTVYDAKNKKVSVKTTKKKESMTITSKAKLKKGTYYIKVEKNGKSTNGYYGIKIK